MRMWSSESRRVQLKWRLQPHLFFVLLFICIPSTLMGLSQDGIFLFSFKTAVLRDPLSELDDWNFNDDSPCSWNGVMCMGFPAANVGGDSNSSAWSLEGNGTMTTVSRVISLVLPGSELLGSIPGELGLIEHLRHLDLSSNVLNGTLPSELFNSSELRVLSLGDNEVSGELSEHIGMLRNLQVLNLSDNALMGSVPRNLSFLPNLTTVDLSNNYLTGELAGGGFRVVEVLDLGSNIVNGTLPPDLTGPNLRYLNLSYNRLAGEIPAKLGTMISANTILDFSFNNFTGQIPSLTAFRAQKPTAFLGNQDLCGEPLKSMCTIPSTFTNPPNDSSPAGKSPPAFAAMPKSPQGDYPVTTVGGSGRSHGSAGLKPTTIAAIAIGDLCGLGLLFLVIMYIHHSKKEQQQMTEGVTDKKFERPPETEMLGCLPWCARKKSGDGNETSESSENETEDEGDAKGGKEEPVCKAKSQQKNQGGVLISVDGETVLELEMLLKAPAYILGATGGSIVYKAVLADGQAFAVRRIGDSVSTLKDFESQVRAIAKCRHPNLLPLRCFYWGTDEKLLIHDYASNGSLANIFFSKKLGTSPFHLSWETRLRVARGVARGLAYLHEKKCVHGNIKPGNILLTAGMEAVIGDFGIERLLSSDSESKPGASARQFGSKRSTLSQSSLPDLSPTGAGDSPIPSSRAPPPYQAPEFLKCLKPNQKWDVYSFGMVLLELMAGRVFLEVELMRWNAGFVVEERNRVLKMADPALRGEVDGKEEILLTCFKLGFSCASMAPHRRPSMKDAVQVLERVVFASASSSSSS